MGGAAGGCSCCIWVGACVLIGEGASGAVVVSGSGLFWMSKN